MNRRLGCGGEKLSQWEEKVINFREIRCRLLPKGHGSFAKSLWNNEISELSHYSVILFDLVRNTVIMTIN